MLNKREDSRPNVRQILQCTFLHESMHECNRDYNLGLDLSQFEVKRQNKEADNTEEEHEEDDAGGSECADNLDVFSGESEPEEGNEASNELMKSAANLKFANMTMTGKAEGLRKYLSEQMSKAEFEKARALVKESSEVSTEELQQQVAEVIGADKATVLCP